MAVLVPRSSARAVVLSALAAAAGACGLGYLVQVWPAPEPFPVHVAPPPQLVPMQAGFGQVGGDDPQCLAFLDEWVRHPNWQLTVTRGYSGCTGESIGDAITVDATGHAVWTGPRQPTRTMHLTPAQLAKLHAAAGLSCDRDRELSYSSSWIDVAWGGTGAPSRRVLASDAQDQIELFFADAIDAYVSRRMDERRDFRATVEIPAFAARVLLDRAVTVTVDATGRVDVRAGRRRVHATLANREEIVAVIDWVELGGALPFDMPQGLVGVIDHATYDAGWQD